MPSSQNTTVLTIWSSTFKTQILQGKKKEKKLLKNSATCFFVFFLLCFIIKLTFLMTWLHKNGNGLQTAVR